MVGWDTQTVEGTYSTESVGRHQAKRKFIFLVFWEVVHEGLGDARPDSDNEGLSHICLGAEQR